MTVLRQSWLSVTERDVRPWFEQYGATLTDAHSFRAMIGVVKADLAGLQKAFAGLDDAYIMNQVAEDTKAANELIAKMETRLEEILNGRT